MTIGTTRDSTAVLFDSGGRFALRWCGRAQASRTAREHDRALAREPLIRSFRSRSWCRRSERARGMSAARSPTTTRARTRPLVRTPASPTRSITTSTTAASLTQPRATHHLLPDSSLADAGDPATAQGLDPHGNPLVTDGNLDGVVGRDIEAFELPGPVTPRSPPVTPAPPIAGGDAGTAPPPPPRTPIRSPRSSPVSSRAAGCSPPAGLPPP